MNKTRFKVLYTRKRNARSKFTDFPSIRKYLFIKKKPVCIHLPDFCLTRDNVSLID